MWHLRCFLVFIALKPSWMCIIKQKAGCYLSLFHPPDSTSCNKPSSLNSQQCPTRAASLVAGHPTKNSGMLSALTLTIYSIPLKVLENLKQRLPKFEPYVLSHCDLNLDNVMVQDGKVVGILDWEYAAYFPIWYEYVSASFGFTDMYVEWKNLLQEHLGAHDEGHEDAKAFWKNLCNLRLRIWMRRARKHWRNYLRLVTKV